MGGYKTCSGILSTGSGMSSLSVLCLVGIYDAEEHGITGMKAGHWHLSLLHFWHMLGFISCDMFIHSNADSKSKLALLLCNSLRYVMMVLPFSVGVPGVLADFWFGSCMANSAMAVDGVRYHSELQCCFLVHSLGPILYSDSLSTKCRPQVVLCCVGVSNLARQHQKKSQELSDL